MKFFNLDLHVSVIEDTATQFRALGHEVESHLMSGHAWVMGHPRASRGNPPDTVGYGTINERNWESFFRDIPSLAATEAWQKENKHLDAFDGFISTYPSAFSMLYDGFRGKNIINIPVRYDLCVIPEPEHMRFYNQRLIAGIDAGKTVVVANSQYDALYFEYFTGKKCRHISSTCDYIDKLTSKWSLSGEERFFYAFGERVTCDAAQNRDQRVLNVRRALGERYSHADVVKARGVVWFPYTTSIMSFFEHYWLGIPLFVPTGKFLLDLFDRKLALSSFSWHPDPLGGSVLPRVGTNMPDPHTRAGMETWLDTYDFYNIDEFPHVTYFNSGEQLQEIINTVTDSQLVQTSLQMHMQNEKRRLRNLVAWAEVIG